MEAATAPLLSDPQMPTAPEMPTTSSSDRVDADNIGCTRDKTETTSELRPTSYSFTGSALSSGNIADLNEKGAEASKDNNNQKDNSTSNSSSNNNSNDKDKDNDESLYECNICLDTAKDAVVSMCGHLFCWPCLHQWLMTRPNRKLCPVCKAAVDKDKVIPLYGRNSTRQEDPR